MLNSRILLVPIGLQMVCMAFDEIHFHRGRGLPRWERIGHPLDTLTVLLCLLWLVFVPPSTGAVAAYVGLSICSCLFVTKDEGVHLSYCRVTEQRLHAVLFTLHPVVLLSSGLLWPAAHGIRDGMPGWIRYTGGEHVFLISLCAVVFGFGLFQFVYWNLLWSPSKAIR
jgi:hypothetical protein